MKHQRRISGFIFIEMLVILGLMAVAGLVSARLFSASMRSISAARAAEDRQAAIDNMSAALRRDAWTATNVQVPDARTIDIATTDGNVRWRFEAGAALRSGSSESRWVIPAMEANLEDANITLRAASKAPTQIPTSRFIIPTMVYP